MSKTILELAQDLFAAKREEQAATDKRIACEVAIALLVPTDEDGSKTVDVGDGLKVNVKRGLNYKANIEAIQDISQIDLPEGIALPLKHKVELDIPAYEVLKDTCPAIFMKIAKFVTVTPKKVAVTLKLA